MDLFARSLIKSKNEEKDEIIHKFFVDYALSSNAVRHVLVTHARGNNFF